MHLWKPNNFLRRRLRKLNPESRDHRGHNRDADDPEILHEGDQFHIRAERLSHHNHRGCCPGRRTPNSRRPRQPAPPAQQPSEHAADTNGCEYNTQKDRPATEKGRHDRGCDRRRNQAADDRLHSQECRSWETDRAAINSHQDPRHHWPEEEWRRKSGRVQSQRQQHGSRHNYAPLCCTLELGRHCFPLPSC
jgi:hypothetical protein